ncbi:MAG: SufE family protein [Devosia sp.]|jgi:cysteine desulfuration protein SufE|uniref:SufE family protein n=1 Tax=unclassified Devosia TaxID=196773 RepID=UPI0019DBD765|nr:MULTISPECIES: SufE family protein [unclassified Devosia]MBF0680910.1 SufE family protein [Devosia sp.]WEJ32384.1 SufE family protein [Devosia sp. SD17-2]
MTHPQAFQDIADNLSFLDDWEDRYRYIIELGQSLAKLDETERTDANKVNGCVSQVWLVAEPVPAADTPSLRFRGESDAMIVQGLVAVLLSLYSDRPASEIAETDAIALFDEIGLREHLTTQRSNGLVAMVNRIRGQARALVN